jgi:hypothetical protein
MKLPSGRIVVILIAFMLICIGCAAHTSVGFRKNGGHLARLKK